MESEGELLHGFRQMRAFEPARRGFQEPSFQQRWPLADTGQQGDRFLAAVRDPSSDGQPNLGSPRYEGRLSGMTQRPGAMFGWTNLRM